jgi:LuxR family maltose regulon positive regulatory protein
MEEEATATLVVSPALGHIIERPRLTTLLAESGARVILLIAPAGYGKTTLARQWTARQSGPVAWYRTTRASGDVAALAVGLDNVLAAAAPVRSRDPHRIGAVAAANPSPSPLARALVSTYGGLTRDVLLVVDEYEAAGTREADELLRALVEELDIRFLVTSRDRPHWLSPRFATYGEGLEIGPDELAMTDSEARDVLSKDRSPGDPDQLLETARGWPAVIGLAAMRAARDLPSLRLAPRMLYDFFATQLLDLVPQEVSEGLTLLGAASIGDTATAELVLGSPASLILEEARQKGLVQIEDDGALSMHPLFRDLLLSRLRGSDDNRIAEVVEQLRSLIDARRWDEALAVAEAVPEREFVSTALRCALPELVRSGRAATLRRWTDVGRAAGAHGGLVDYADAEVALRDADFDRAIALSERAAQALTGDLAARAHALAAQGANLTDRATRAHRHLSAAARLSSSLETRQAALWGRFNQAVDQQRRNAPRRLAAFELASDGSVEHRVRTAHGRLSLALLEGEIEARIGDAEVALTELHQGVDPMVVTSFLNIFAYTLAVAARYDRSLATAEEEERLASEYELAFVGRYALLNRARAMIGLRRFEAADRALTRVEAQLGADRDPFLEAHCRMYRARLLMSSGDLPRAEEQLTLPPSSRLAAGHRADYAALRALIVASAGRTAEALDWIDEARRTSRFRETVSMAAVAEAVATLDRSPRRSIELYDVAMRSEALDPLVLGLRVSLEFASRVCEYKPDRDRLVSLLVSSNDAALARRVGVAIPRAVLRTQPLSPRELEVHELIAQGRTNREIATALYISESTTKLHVRHIFEKLGVHSRVEAARIWAGSGGIEPST